MTVFLVVAGLTGTLITFYHELDAALNPELFEAPPATPGASMLHPLELRQRLLARVPDAEINLLSLRHREGETFAVYVDYPTLDEDAAHERDDQFFLDPHTGDIVGSRHGDDLSQGRKALMPFIYRLHNSLGLGEVGSALFGIIALLWTIDCFVGAYLTLPTKSPRKRPNHSAKDDAAQPRPFTRLTRWLRAWRSSWLLRTTKLFSLVFTWHRASGLWIWGMLFVFAWSAVGLNLYPVYAPMMKTLFPSDTTREEFATLESPRQHPTLNFTAALARGQTLAVEQAQDEQFQLAEPWMLMYYARTGLYRYRFESSLDVSNRYPATAVWFDGNTGELKLFEAPTGKALGNTITTWLHQLHFGAVRMFGMPFRIFVSFMGIVVAALSVTGVWIWWRKRSKRVRA